MARDFLLPDLGEGIVEAQIISILVNEGDNVEEDQALMEVETDKAAVEIPSPFGGTVEKVHAKPGDTVNVGDVMVTFSGEAADKKSRTPATAAKVAKTAQASSKPTAQVATAVVVASNTPASIRTRAAAAPAVRKRARELGVKIDACVGSGPGGRITKVDVERSAAGGAPPAQLVSPMVPAVQSVASDPAAPLPGVVGADQWGPTRREPISQIRKTIANQMTRSAFTAVHVTHCDDVDITELDRARRRINEVVGDDARITMMAFVIRAVCLALKKHPIFNSSFDLEAGEILYKDYINLGIAVDSKRGLIVPVIRNADRLSISGIASALRTLAEQIRSNRFAIEDLRGGTFTITNVGALGGGVNTPIINYPEVAILGLGRARKVPVLRNGELAEVNRLPANLSFDHRATDGANAARFLNEIFSYLETPEKFLLD